VRRRPVSKAARSEERDITEMGAEWSLQLSFMRDLSLRWVMSTNQPTEFLCAVCSKSVDLTIDLNADERGKAVHQQCYADQLNGKVG
jgi:hypothetical protein